jgi:hypothetical protein
MPVAIDCYNRLLQIESRVIPSRMDKAREEMMAAENRERELQSVYAKLVELTAPQTQS